MAAELTPSPVLSPRPHPISLKQIYKDRSRDSSVARSLNSRSPMVQKKPLSPGLRLPMPGDIALLISSFSSATGPHEVRKTMAETLQPVRILPLLIRSRRQPSFSESATFSVIGKQSKLSGTSPVRGRVKKPRKLGATLQPLKMDHARRQLRKIDTSTRHPVFPSGISDFNSGLRFLSTEAVRSFDGICGWTDN